MTHPTRPGTAVPPMKETTRVGLSIFLLLFFTWALLFSWGVVFDWNAFRDGDWRFRLFGTPWVRKANLAYIRPGMELSQAERILGITDEEHERARRYACGLCGPAMYCYDGP